MLVLATNSSVTDKHYTYNIRFLLCEIEYLVIIIQKKLYNPHNSYILINNCDLV